MLGVVQSEVGKERVNCREAHVAGGHGVVPLALEVFEERRDERRVELGDVEPARRAAGATRRESEQ